MALTPSDLAAIEAAWEIEIETRAASDAPVHSTIIWAVTDGPDAFIRSVNGSRARWYREAIAHPAVVVRIGDDRIPARAVPAVDPPSVGRTSGAFERKYAGDPDMASMLEPHTLETTLRLEPA
jgi:hypothetical protein